MSRKNDGSWKYFPIAGTVVSLIIDLSINNDVVSGIFGQETFFIYPPIKGLIIYIATIALILYLILNWSKKKAPSGAMAVSIGIPLLKLCLLII